MLVGLEERWRIQRRDEEIITISHQGKKKSDTESQKNPIPFIADVTTSLCTGLKIWMTGSRILEVMKKNLLFDKLFLILNGGERFRYSRNLDRYVSFFQ